MRFFCIGFRCENDVAICINLYLRGCIIHFRKYGLPYGLSVSLCTLHLMVTHFDATLGMGGWLDLTQQGLSPCKKYRASWRSSVKSYRIIDLTHLLYLSNLKVNINCLRKWDVSIYSMAYSGSQIKEVTQGNLEEILVSLLSAAKHLCHTFIRC